jgi:predicted RNA binding protein YcfA (HicA-like mRNA interferase family)
MAKEQRRVTELLRREGYVLVRQNRHSVWRHTSTGQQIVTAITPSDWREVRNVLSCVKRLARKETR